MLYVNGAEYGELWQQQSVVVKLQYSRIQGGAHYEKNLALVLGFRRETPRAKTLPDEETRGDCRRFLSLFRSGEDA